MKTPEEMAEAFADNWHKDCDYPPEILRHTKKATASVFLAGYQVAKDNYKDAISAYEDVAKQMLEEAVRIMTPTDQLADADKVINSLKKLDSSAPIDTNSIDTGTKMQWISVKDTLPEDRDIVAVWTNAGDIHAAWRKNGAWLMFNPCCTYESELKGISHWHEIADTPEEQQV